MKLIDRIIYFIFSSIKYIIIALAIMVLYDVEFAKNIIIYIIIIEIMAIKGMYFQSGKEEKRDAIILENSSGKLIISRKTLENLVKDIANNVNGVENAIAKVMVEKDTDLAILIDIVVKEGSIKDITKKLQEEVKMSIKKASDLNVAEVNVNIKNINKNVKIDDIDIKKDVDEKQENEEDN